MRVLRLGRSVSAARPPLTILRTGVTSTPSICLRHRIPSGNTRTITLEASETTLTPGCEWNAYLLVWLAEKEGVQDAVIEGAVSSFIQVNAWPEAGGC